MVEKYEFSSEGVMSGDQKMFLFPSTLTSDLKECVGSELFSDVTFEEEDVLQENSNNVVTTNFHAHKVSFIYEISLFFR